MTYEIDKTYNQFILRKKEFIQEINSTVYHFEHDRLGCPVLAIKNDDINKTFSASFNTIPTDSTGVAHILEHSVLMGSEKYPVKDVFGEINKGGLMTFLNAMTGSDVTYYPFATRNDKEYFNIMDVYCDVVFNPLLQRSTFEQEGWHYHQESTESELEFQGVVYNEMKGAFSDPIRHIFHNIYKGLMPNSTYAHESGGDPKNIPDLSYEEFCAFHKKHYHASNGMFFFYGNAPLDEELSYLEQKFDAHFPEKAEIVEVLDGGIATKPLFVEKTYASDSDNTAEKTYIAVGTATCKITDRKKNISLQIIANILFNSDASPLKNAITSSGLCKDFGGLYSATSSYHTFMLSYLVGSEPEHLQAISDLYQKSLAEMVEKGLDQELVLSELNKYEFGYREDGSKSQRGLDLIGKALPAIKFNMDPFTSLKSEEILAEIREDALNNKYFEKLIKELLLDNPATVTLTLSPNPQQQQKEADEVENRLTEYSSQLSANDKQDIIEKTQKTMTEQLVANTPENLKLLPQLSLSDLSDKIDYHVAETIAIEGQNVIVNDLNTNHISYIDIGFNFEVLPSRLLIYLDIFATIITEIGTKNLDFMAFAKELATNTGGFSCSIATYGNKNPEEKMKPILWFHLKCLAPYLEKSIELISSLLADPTFTDRKRIREIVGREFSWTDHSAQSEGYSLATARVSAHLSEGGMYQEYFGGISAFRELRDLSNNYDNKEEQFLADIKEIADLLFNKNNLQLAITANNAEIECFKRTCPALIKGLKQKDTVLQSLIPLDLPNNSAFISSAEVVYAVQGGNLFPKGEGYNGHFEVLRTYLSRDYLWNSVRQMGGAYGCFIQFSQLNGNMNLVSYRDPQVAKTYKAYQEIATVVEKLDIPQQVLEQLIIGTYGNFNPHQSQPTIGAIAKNELLTGVTPEYKKAIIEEIKSTTVQDLKSFAPQLEQMLGNSYRAIIGNRKKIENDAQLFDEVSDL
ncbi:MAG: insulinase family protein [Desulfotalea sp.]